MIINYPRFIYSYLFYYLIYIRSIYLTKRMTINHYPLYIIR